MNLNGSKIFEMKRKILIASLILCSYGSTTNVFAYNEIDLAKLNDVNVCERCDLSNAFNLSGAHPYPDYSGANLEGANLEGANLIGTKLRHVNFVNANLQGANLSRTDLEGADFTGANLRGVNLSGAVVCKECIDLDVTMFSRTSESMLGVNRAYFLGVDFSGANLKHFKARSANFTDSDLSNTNLEEGNSSKAIFCNTKTPWGIENIGCKK